jgi:phosphoribosylanthranilate isomerase
MRTRAKICGITRIQDIQSVVQAGADGLITDFPKMMLQHLVDVH